MSNHESDPYKVLRDRNAQRKCDAQTPEGRAAARRSFEDAVTLQMKIQEGGGAVGDSSAALEAHRRSVANQFSVHRPGSGGGH